MFTIYSLFVVFLYIHFVHLFIGSAWRWCQFRYLYEMAGIWRKETEAKRR
jgi:membrane protein YdbS with pleckstrin-like domain